MYSATVMTFGNAGDVPYFHELLEGAQTDPDHIPITFQRHKGEVFQLEVSVKLQVLKQLRVATYCIEMEPISLERIDVLESKMRDLQDEVDQLREDSEEVIENQSRGLQDLEVSVKLLQDHAGAREKEIAELKKQFMTLGTSHRCSSTTLACTTRVEKNQQFAVKCPVSLTGMSFLTIVRLGK
ncbi:hypothetical protein PR003_g4515 [Phytophthora rubi]|uniref:Uncharacterized protein n=1 Tax=Phytophthora rubi TaxID=129364 RepID=A0A6A4FVP4_9STRA|nr:hypothetical protein PR003_g4515 [Phytophthora rubi]